MAGIVWQDNKYPSAGIFSLYDHLYTAVQHLSIESDTKTSPAIVYPQNPVWMHFLSVKNQGGLGVNS